MNYLYLKVIHCIKVHAHFCMLYQTVVTTLLFFGFGLSSR